MGVDANKMRVAILSDIHGNPIALDAVLADIERQGGVDAFWLLGDYVAIGHDPVDVLARIVDLPNAVFIRGNTDRYLVTGERPFPSIADARKDPSLVQRIVNVNAGFAWTQGIVTAAGWLDWLADLPLDFRATLPDGSRFLGVHCAPGTDDGIGLHPALNEAEIAAALSGCAADLICVGHTHEVMNMHVNGRHLVNVGSVSNPKAPDLRASYGLLQAGENGYTIQICYAAYDRQAVIDALELVRHPSRAFISRFMRGDIYP